MEEIINFEWCEKHNMKQMRVNVASDKSYYLEKDKYSIIVYIESMRGEKKLFVFNPINGKQIEYILPKISLKENKYNEFTTDDLKIMCKLVDLEYPF